MEVKVDRISYRYQSSGPTVLEGIDFHVQRGETVAIIGESGCGKSTLLRMMNGLLRPERGNVLLDGSTLEYSKLDRTRRHIGYVMQEAALFPHLSIEENISLIARIDRWDQRQIDARMDEVLQLVNLDGLDIRTRQPSEVSGGQRQRVAIARALFLDPSLLLMDESFAHLDSLLRLELVNEFIKMNQRLNKTVILVTHDLAIASRMAKRILLLASGRIEVDTSSESFIDSPDTDLAKRFVATLTGPKESP